LENYAFQVRNSIRDEKLAGQVSEADKKKVEDAVAKTTQWLDSNQHAEKEEFEQQQRELEGIVLPILQNLSGGGGGMAGGFPGAAGFPGGTGATSSGPAAAADEGPKIEEID
jgi:L1 cell adhesion molecule like protein